MKRSFLNLNQKIRSNKAETLSELLIAVLIIMLGLTMFASAMMASRKLLAEGDTILKEYYAKRNILEQENSNTQINGTLIVEPVDDLSKTRINFALPQKDTSIAGKYQINLYTEQVKKDGAQAQNATDGPATGTGVAIGPATGAGTGTTTDSSTGTGGAASNGPNYYRYSRK